MMSYLASFDVTLSRHGFGTITLSRSGSSNISVYIPAMSGINAIASRYVSSFNHWPNGLASGTSPDEIDSPGIGDTVTAVSFGERIAENLRGSALSAGWPSPTSINIVFNPATSRYTISYGSALSAITFSNSFTMALFGFTSNFSGSSTSVVGASTPAFVIESTLQAVSTKRLGMYTTPAGISVTSRISNGRPFSITRPAVPLHRDWIQEHEIKPRVFKWFRVAQAGYCHQQLFEDCRSHLPFVVYNGWGDGNAYVFYLRPDACRWGIGTHSQASDGDDTQFNIVYRARVVGVLAA